MYNKEWNEKHTVKHFSETRLKKRSIYKCSSFTKGSTDFS